MSLRAGLSTIFILLISEGFWTVQAAPIASKALRKILRSEGD